MQRQRLRCSDDLRKVVCWPLTSRQVVHTIPNSHSPYYRKLVNLILFNGGWKGGGIQQEWGQGVRSASPCGISRLWLPGSGSAAPGQRPRSREKWPHDSPQCPVHSSQQTPANRQAVATGPPGRTMAAPGLGPQWSELPRRSPGALLPKATALISSWLLGEEKAELEIVQPTSFETHLSFLTSPFRLTSAQGCARFHPPPSPFGPQPTRTSAPRFPVPNGSDVSVPNSSRAALAFALPSGSWSPRGGACRLARLSVLSKLRLGLLGASVLLLFSPSVLWRKPPLNLAVWFSLNFSYAQKSLLFIHLLTRSFTR